MRIQKIIKTRTGKEMVLRNYRERKEGSQPPVWTDNTVLLPKK